MFDNPGDWALENGIRIGIILALAIALHILVKRVIPRAVEYSMEPQQSGTERQKAQAAQRQRVDTVSTVLLRTADVLIVVVAAFLVLAEIGVSLAPLIAGAGVVGIAVGFGAQSLIRDTLAGAFIVFEDQYRTGDVIAVAGVEGTVEGITLRRTLVRDLDGVLHTVPNGEITVASNHTRGWAGINIALDVGYGEDLDRVKELIDEVGSDLAADPRWREDVVQTPVLARLSSFGDSSIELRVLGRTVPHRQWDVADELRRRIRQSLDAAGVAAPFPHRVVISQTGNPLPTDAAG